MQVEAILAHIGLYREILRKRRWWIIGISGLLGLYFAYNAHRSPTYYQAKAIFHPENETSSGFNIDNPVSFFLGSPSASIESSTMTGILNSRRISEMVVKDTVVLVRDTFFVVNPDIHYGILNGDTISLDTSRVLLADAVNDLFKPGFSVLGYLIRLVSKPPEIPTKQQRIYAAGKTLRKQLNAIVNDEGFIDMELSIPNTRMAKVLSDKYIRALRDYYIGQRTAKAERNLSFFTFRVDSVKQELESVNRQIALFFDQSRYRVMAREEVLPRELEAQQEYLKELYINLTLSREQAASQLLEDTPILQVLDYPMPPFIKEDDSRVFGLLLGGLLGFLLTGFWFCRKQLRKDTWELIRMSLEPSEAPEDAAY